MDTETAGVNGAAAFQRAVRALSGSALGERFSALQAAIGEGNFRRVGIHTDDADCMQAAVIACAAAGADSVLLPHTAKEIVSFCDAQVDAWIGKTLAGARKPVLATNLSSAAPFSGFAASRLTLMSSGSTGSPKQLTVPFAMLCAEVLAFRSLFECDRPCEVRSTVSLQHRFGLVCHALLPLLRAWPVKPRVCAIPDELLAGETITPVWWITSPMFLARLAEHPHLAAWRRKVAGITCAGARLDENVRGKIEEALEVVVTDVYGSSETGVLAARRSSDAFSWLPAVQAESGALETVVRAPWLSAATRLGDRLEACGGRRFHLRGRLDSVVKLADKRVDLAAVQQALIDHQWVTDSHLAVHERHAHLFAWLALSPAGIAYLRRKGRKAVIESLRQRVAAAFDKIAVPRYWRLQRYLPRNAQAKLSRAQVLAAMNEVSRAPRWRQVEGTETLEMVGEVPLDLIYFRGHFDALAIVAGVVQLKWVCELAGRWLGREISSARMENLKFQHLLRPGDPIAVKIRFNAPRDKLLFLCQSNGHNCASGRIVL